MSTGNGGERDRLAPVIPLFGGAAPVASDNAGASELMSDDAVESAHEPHEPVPAGRSAWHPTWATERRPAPEPAETDSPNVELAEKALLKKLRTRSLSVSEAREMLRGHELDQAATEHVLASMEEYGYLDDAALADQLVHAGVDRKGQGRQVIAQTLSKRGIPRDVADAALAALPDDDFERALEFARGKARSLRSLDRDTALRRLTGQLARRGYGGSLAMTAARAALDEVPGDSGGVRFR
jgi:regulatory protein